MLYLFKKKNITEEKFKDDIINSFLDFFIKIKIKNHMSSKWIRNDFSSIFKLKIIFEKNSSEYFIKIPRAQINNDKINIISKDDRNMGKNEYNSLCFLKKNWSKYNYIEFVKPLTYLEKYNAVITQSFNGNDFFLDIRKEDILNRFNLNKSKSDINLKLKNISESISNYHQLCVGSEFNLIDFEYKILIQKIINKLTNLEKKIFFKINFKYFFYNLLKLKEEKIKIRHSYTLKGLDIRNILINEKGLIKLLDPGKLKYEPEVAGIARYLVTTELLYWGKLLFFIKFSISNNLKNSIMAGFSTLSLREKKLLNIFLLKEYIKHWDQAYNNIDLKFWPKLIKKFLKKYYVDNFFIERVHSIISKI
jgi:hypothetical protein